VLVASPKLVHGTQGKGHNVIQYLTQPLFGKYIFESSIHELDE